MEASNPDLYKQLWTSLLAGGVAGCTVDVSLHPLDSLKTRIQAVVRHTKINWQNPYAGICPALIASFPSAAVFWVTYQGVKDGMSRYRVTDIPALKHLVGACAASVTSSIVRTPFEIIKQQMQVGKFRTSSEAVRSILASKGPRGLFAGTNSLILREIPFESIQFLLYEYLKHEDYGGNESCILKQLVYGGLSGGFAAFITTPIDVVKTRMMVKNKIGISTRDAVMEILRKEGGAALWKGWQLRVLLTTVGGMIFFGTYEALFHQLLHKY
jgi:solute carrier family 25 S-adenosylmethionine transporter 26